PRPSPYLCGPYPWPAAATRTARENTARVGSSVPLRFLTGRVQRRAPATGRLATACRFPGVATLFPRGADRPAFPRPRDTARLRGRRGESATTLRCSARLR